MDIEPSRTTTGRRPSYGTTWLVKATGRGAYLWPALALAGLFAVDQAVDRAVEREIGRTVERHLRDVLDANERALTFWFDRRLDAVAGLASDAHVRAHAAALAVGPAGPPAPPGPVDRDRALAGWREALEPYARAQRSFDVLFVGPDLRVQAALADRLLGATLEDEAAADVARRALAGTPAASRVHRSGLPFADAGRHDPGQVVILLAAPVRGDDGATLGALLVAHRGLALSTLLQGRDQRSPTYALDAAGTFVTRSPREEQLEQAGLLAPGTSSVLGLASRDPGVDLRVDRAAARRADQPLTTSAAGVAARDDGLDLTGYRDYRGVPVVGAWTWVPGAELGLVTELEVEDAYAPLRILRRVFYGVLAALALAAVVISGFTLLMRRAGSKRAGPYTLITKLGEGAMGVVWEARHALLRRSTAVKVLGLSALSTEARQRFEREAQATASLCHPNTVTVYDYGRTGEGGFYFAMERLQGVTLEELVRRWGPLPQARAVHLLAQIAGSLAEAHAAGLVHRDVKPANIMVVNRAGILDFVKVLDFGLVTAAEGQVRLTAAKQVMGTPLYMAPEAVHGSGQKVDARADVHALGGVASWLLTGRPPYDADTVAEVLGKVAFAPFEPLSARLARQGRSVTPALDALITRCLAKKPEDRPRDGGALLAELEALRPEVGAWTQAQARAWWDVHRLDEVCDPTAATAADVSLGPSGTVPSPRPAPASDRAATETSLTTEPPASQASTEPTEPDVRLPRG